MAVIPFPTPEQRQQQQQQQQPQQKRLDDYIRSQQLWQKLR